MKKYQQLHDAIVEEIRSGRLAPGSRLPSIRETVRRTGLSQTTVEHAWDLLIEEGLILSHPQSGCCVSGRPLPPRPTQSQPAREPGVLYDLRTDVIHPDMFEMKAWKRCLRDVLDDSAQLSSYGDSRGEPELRQALADYAWTLRRLRTDPGSILVGSSFQSLLFILTSLIGRPLTVAMEAGVPASTRHIFLSAGWTILDLESDEQGPLPEELKRPFDCLYLTTASLGSRKKALRQRQDLYRDLFVIEDDYNGELTYWSGPRNALSATLDSSLYIGAFSRVLLPSLRLSYMVLPDWLNRRFDPALYAPVASKTEQLALARYIREGSLERHVRRLNRRYRRRCETVLKVLEGLPAFLDEAYLCVELPGFTLPESFACDRTLSGIRVSFASLSETELEPAFQALRRALEPLDGAGR